MFTRLIAAVFVMVAIAAPARADNFHLFNAVERQVLQYPHLTIFDSVDVKIDGGMVTLLGKVTTPLKRTDLEKRVARVDGVRAVENRIEVLPISAFDDALRIRIAHAIYSGSSFNRYTSVLHAPIHIVVERGHVTLTGVVTNDAERQVAGMLASHSLAFSVANELRTRAEAQAALEAL